MGSQLARAPVARRPEEWHWRRCFAAWAAAHTVVEASAVGGTAAEGTAVEAFPREDRFSLGWAACLAVRHTEALVGRCTEEKPS